MNVEKMSKTFNGNNNEIPKKVLEMEKMNRMIENATDLGMKEGVILKMDKLNEQLKTLEKESGLSQKQIMENYEKLTKRVAEENINELIKGMSPKEQKLILTDIAKGVYDSLLEAVKKTNPQKLALVTSCALLLTVGSMVTVPVVEAGNYYNSEQYRQEIQGIVQEVKNMIAQIEIYTVLLNAHSEHSDDFVITKTANGVITVGYAKKEVARLSRKLQDIKKINPWIKEEIHKGISRKEREREEMRQSKENKKVREKIFKKSRGGVNLMYLMLKRNTLGEMK